MAKQSSDSNKRKSTSSKSPRVSSKPKNFPILQELELFQYVVDHVGEELILIDREGWIVYLNDAAVKGLGYTREYLLKKRILDFFKDRISIASWKRDHYEQLKTKKKPIKYQIQRVVKGGKVQTIEITAVYMPYKQNGYILSVARNISAQITLQDSLTEALDMFHCLCEGAGDPIFIITLKGQIAYANPAAEQFFKKSVWKIKGKYFKNFVDKDSFTKAWKLFLKAKKDSNQFQVEVSTLTNKVKRPLELTVSPMIKEGKVDSFHVIARDISERREFEMLMRESEKMQAVQYFVLGTAKELKHPILAVLKRTQALLNKYKNRDFEYIGFKEYSDIISTLKSINDQVKYCYDTTQRLLNLNQKRIGIRKDCCQVNTIIKEIVELKETQLISNDLKCKLQLANNLPMIAIGKIDFIQIVECIVNNAIQSMPSGGSLTIKSAYLPASNQVQIEVKDQGVGIPKKELPHVFEPFYTTKLRGVGKNSGLGLPIVYSLIKSYRGEIIIDSNLRQGTIVKVFLPISDKKQAPQFPL